MKNERNILAMIVYIFLFMVSLIFEAIWDTRYHSFIKHAHVYKSLWFLTIGIVLAYAYAKEGTFRGFLVIVLTYLLARFGLFDWLYGHFSGYGVDYTGTAGLWHRFLEFMGQWIIPFKIISLVLVGFMPGVYSKLEI